MVVLKALWWKLAVVHYSPSAPGRQEISIISALWLIRSLLLNTALKTSILAFIYWFSSVMGEDLALLHNLLNHMSLSMLLICLHHIFFSDSQYLLVFMTEQSSDPMYLFIFLKVKICLIWVQFSVFHQQHYVRCPEICQLSMDNTYELLSGASCSVSPWKPLSWSFFCVSLGRRLPGALVLVLGSSSPPSSEPRLLLCLGSFFLVYDLFFRSWCSGDFLRKGAKEVTLHVSIFKITPLLMLGRLAGHRILIVQDISSLLFAFFVAIENFDPSFI